MFLLDMSVSAAEMLSFLRKTFFFSTTAEVLKSVAQKFLFHFINLKKMRLISAYLPTYRKTIR